MPRGRTRIMAGSSSSDDDGPADGASATRGRVRDPRRTRRLIVGALLDALSEGAAAPSAKELAARAGVSERSVFVHFGDLHDLRVAAASAQHARIVAALTPVTSEGTLVERVRDLVAQRERIHQLQAVRLVALVEARRHPDLASQMAETDAVLGDQVRTALTPELGSDDELAALVETLLSWAARTHLTEVVGLSQAAASRAVERAVLALLEP